MIFKVGDFSCTHRPVVSVLLILSAVLIGVLAACGSSDDDSGEPVGSVIGQPDEEGIRLITKPDAFYSIDDLTAVGFKKSKQFDVETVPGAVDIWYGFFQQQDIEVRFYESHEAAMDQGVELAEVVIGKKAGQRDFLIPVVNLYPAYAVVGNTIMLCERQLSTCEALIDVLE
ncbi:MAG: hypothetical protein H8D69_00480 [Chloroflexi bacterium]|nr:hypothetical protein [Chloroflexota bacterium]